MTTKINFAFDPSGNIVHIKDAIRGGEYYCVYCEDRLFAAKGKKQIHHFRHFSKDNESEYCHLYSSSDSDYTILYEEEKWKNKLRFVIDSGLELKLKFPTIPSELIAKMNKEDRYFNIYVQDKNISSIFLDEKRGENYLKVNIAEDYRIIYEKLENAKSLNYETIEQISLLENETLLFKNVGGEFINIPYSKTSLSEEFYIISRKKLILNNEIIIKNYQYINNLYIYHLYINEVNEQIITWFARNTHYNIVPNRKWLDLIEPNTFLYDESVILIEDADVLLKVTPPSRHDRINFIDERGYHNNLLFDNDGFIRINLAMNHLYNFSLRHEIANNLSIKRVENININGNMYDININGSKFVLPIQLREEKVKVESDKLFYVYQKDDIPLEMDFYFDTLHSPIHFPYIGTVLPYIKPEQLDKNLLNSILYENLWVTTSNRLFMKIFNLVNNLNDIHKGRYIKILLSNYNKLPYKLVKNLKGER